MPESAATARNHEETVQAGLAEIWERARPTLLARVAVVETAIAELGRSPAGGGRSGIACSESHKLAGVLGTFGLDRGTELARDLEQLLADPRAHGTALLKGLADELRQVVETTQLQAVPPGPYSTR